MTATTKLTKEQMSKTHYVYRITNTKLNKHYYGSRTSKCKSGTSLLEDLRKYQSSSTDKEFKQDQKDNPQDYKYKVVRIFDDIDKSLSLEHILHEMFNVSINKSFYNKCKATKNGFSVAGMKMSSKSIAQRYTTRPDWSHSEETKIKMRKPKNYTRTREHTEKIRQQVLGRKDSIETKIKKSIANKGRVISKHHKKILSDRMSINNPAKYGLNDKWIKNRTKSKMKNHKYSTFKFYNNEDEIIMISKNKSFSVFCKENKLPYTYFRRTYLDKIKIDYNDPANITIAKSKNYYQYQGWYVVKED